MTKEAADNFSLILYFVQNQKWMFVHSELKPENDVSQK